MQVLQRIGGAILAALAASLGILTFVTSWNWWITALLAALTLIGVVLMLLPSKKETPERQRPETVTFKGDADGSKIGEAWANSDVFVAGSARNMQIDKLTHRPRHGED